MARSRLQVLAGASLLLHLAGCAHVTHSALPPPAASVATASPDDLPVCARKKVTVDLAGPLPPVPTAESDGGSAGLPPYHLLGDQECLCRAVIACNMANTMDMEQQVITVREENDHGHCKGEESPEAHSQRTILYYMELEARNRSGAEALDKYYQLGAAEGSLDIIRDGQRSVDSTLAKARSLKKQGLEVPLPLDEAKLYDQQLELKAQSVRIGLNIEELNSGLRVALGFCPPDAEWRFWPADAFEAGDEPVSAATAVAVGLANRPDLLLLCHLENELSSNSDGALKQLMRSINGALAMSKSSPLCPMLHLLLSRLCPACDDTRELLIRQAQLHAYHTQREREAVEQIDQAVRTITAQKVVLALARHQVKNWEAKVQEAQDKEKKGVGSYAETADAEGEWFKARRKVVEETTNLQRAWVLLRQAQGIMPADCIPPTAAH